MRLADGTPAVVKDLKPFDDVEDELRGAHYLSWRDGAGAVTLLGFEGRQMLLEFGGDELLSGVLATEGDDAATDIAAEVLERLLSPSPTPPPAELQPLRERFAALFDKAKTGAAPIYCEAARLADRLLSEPHDVRPLHGDLHHDNILFGPRGWLAIDPKGVLGDPAFDAANLFYNPLDRNDLCSDPDRIARMADVLARAIRQHAASVLDHAFAYGCLSAAWHAGDANTVEEERELSIARAVRRVRLG